MLITVLTVFFSVGITVLLLTIWHRRKTRYYINELAGMRSDAQAVFEAYKNKYEDADKQRKEFYEDKFNSEISAIKVKSEFDFLQWKQDYEKKIRVDAVTRSQSSSVGKITEHLLPYFPDFPYNPKDVKFQGDPIDLICYDGMNEGNLKEIVFLEIKTGKYAKLNTHERQLRDIIKNKQVRWEQIRINRGDK